MYYILTIGDIVKSPEASTCPICGEKKCSGAVGGPCDY